MHIKSTTTMIARILVASFVILGGLNVRGETPDAATTAGDHAAENQLMSYRIGPADVLSILIWKHDDMNRTVTVRPDGMISFPLLGEIRAAGMTPDKLQEVLVKRLKEYMNVLPREVTVVVDEVHSYKVSVLGEVKSPGRFEFKSRVTVLGALAEAGGLTDYASKSDIVILRPDHGHMQRLKFNYEKSMESQDSGQQMYVNPGDIILVPQSGPL